jgi:hypothetical protein
VRVPGRHRCSVEKILLPVAAGGATDQTLQALLGWMSPKMIEKYSHVRAEAKRKAVSVFDQASPETESPQFPPQSEVGETRSIMK